MDHAPGAQGIAGFGRLDLDDVGAEIGEDFGGKGTGDELAQFDDPKAFQWQWHVEQGAGVE